MRGPEEKEVVQSKLKDDKGGDLAELDSSCSTNNTTDDAAVQLRMRKRGLLYDDQMNVNNNSNTANKNNISRTNYYNANLNVNDGDHDGDDEMDYVQSRHSTNSKASSGSSGNVKQLALLFSPSSMEEQEQQQHQSHQQSSGNSLGSNREIQRSFSSDSGGGSCSDYEWDGKQRQKSARRRVGRVPRPQGSSNTTITTATTASTSGEGNRHPVKKAEVSVPQHGDNDDNKDSNILQQEPSTSTVLQMQPQQQHSRFPGRNESNIAKAQEQHRDADKGGTVDKGDSDWGDVEHRKRQQQKQQQQQESSPASPKVMKLANMFATSLQNNATHPRQSEMHSSFSEAHADEHRDAVGPLLGEEEDYYSGEFDEEEGVSCHKSRFHYDKWKRTSEVIDLATGKQGGARAHQAMLRSMSSGTPKSASNRRNDDLRKFFHKPLTTLNGSKKNVLLPPKEKPPQDDELKTSMHGRLQVSFRDLSHNESSHGASSNTHTSRKYQPEVGGTPCIPEGQQFRLEAVGANGASSQRSWWSCLLGCLGCGKGRFNIYDDPSTGREMRSKWSMNTWVIRYLHWTFRSSFGAVVVSSAVAFFFATSLFALGIWAIAIRRPTCIGGLPPDDPFTKHNFLEAFEMSWTTFATVGFGLVYPGISTTEPDVKQCTGMTILVSLEAFCGLLFGSLCSAILFARVGRVQSYAQVSFSDPIVIRYGCGLQSSAEVDDSDEEEGMDNSGRDRIPCPILEFRMVNRLFGVMGGEIMDATINTVACIDADQACPTIRKQANQRRGRAKKGKKGGMKRPNQSQPQPGKAPNLNVNIESTSLDALYRQSNTPPSSNTPPPAQSPLDAQKTNAVFKAESVFANLAKTLSTSITQAQAPTTKFFDEDPTGQYVPRRIFAKLDVDPHDHPFFKRVWVVRHVLDEDSPLLKAHARQMVIRNGGYWPRQLNSYEGVRAAILFEQILVSLNGTSNADANTVYAQKVYEFADVYVGYRFANMLYRDLGDESLQCDLRLLNDVTEQSGGGGEPLNLHGLSEREGDDVLAL